MRRDSHDRKEPCAGESRSGTEIPPPGGTCEALRPQLDLHLEGELRDVHVTALLHDHLLHCPACRARAESYDLLTRWVLSGAHLPGDSRADEPGDDAESLAEIPETRGLFLDPEDMVRGDDLPAEVGGFDAAALADRVLDRLRQEPGFPAAGAAPREPSRAEATAATPRPGASRRPRVVRGGASPAPSWIVRAAAMLLLALGCWLVAERGLRWTLSDPDGELASDRDGGARAARGVLFPLEDEQPSPAAEDGLDPDAELALHSDSLDGADEQETLRWIIADRAHCRWDTRGAVPHPLVLYGFREDQVPAPHLAALAGPAGDPEDRAARPSKVVPPDIEWVVEAALPHRARRHAGYRFYLVPDSIAAAPAHRAHRDASVADAHPHRTIEISPVSWLGLRGGPVDLVRDSRSPADAAPLYRVYVVPRPEIVRTPEPLDPGDVADSALGVLDRRRRDWDRWTLPASFQR